MATTDLLTNYHVRLWPAVAQQLYFPFDQIADVQTSAREQGIKSSYELSLLFFAEMPRLFDSRYARSVFHPLVWIEGAPAHIRARGQKFIKKIFKNDDGAVVISSSDLNSLLRSLHNLHEYNLSWRFFCTELEKLVKEASQVKLNDYTSSAVMYLPVSLFALRYLIDDFDRDNHTATWPMELWLYRLPPANHTDFLLFFAKIYDSKEKYFKELTTELAGKPLPKYFSKIFSNKGL